MQWIYSLVLLADDSRWQNLGQRFRGSRAQLDEWDISVGIAVVGGLLVGIFLLSRYASSSEKGRRFHSQRKLFRSLCAAHGLERSDGRLLKRLARLHRISHPARLFLEPERFQRLESGRELSAENDAIEALRRRLFTGALDQPKAQFREGV